jgi:hypothetical protein
MFIEHFPYSGKLLVSVPEITKERPAQVEWRLINKVYTEESEGVWVVKVSFGIPLIQDDLSGPLVDEDTMEVMTFTGKPTELDMSLAFLKAYSTPSTSM